eukprot:CAMPEP_0114118918 /NCGR_PEP_ID=MMETSP0043_2-20121206/5837_1 /TAXON_ID=464988 /ORGANISM="Hemiselmis andersenii, Strain CCMP644" /LENGTH=385 /DNA_ID=CAMNT_0001211437 /DNA_START=12 /DNA_END=1166 /DNA_ORIENTATION=-
MADGSSSVGTISQVLDGGAACTVLWDGSEGRDVSEVSTGKGGVYQLATAVSAGVPSYSPNTAKYVNDSQKGSLASYSSNGSNNYSSITSSQKVRYSTSSSTGITGAAPGLAGNPWPTEAPRYSTSKSSVRARRETTEMDWLDRLTGMDLVSTASYSDVGGEKAKISHGRTTVGLSLYGTRVDYVVPGGPAQLSRQLGKHDEILMVDGRDVSQETLTEAIVGTDQVHTTVKLLVRKADSGRVVEVELMRVSKQSMENMVRLFELLTVLKQNGHNNEEFELDVLRGGQDTTLVLVDKVVSLISAVQIEKYESDMRTRTQFQELYNEMRQHLEESYREIDALEKQKGKPQKEPKDSGKTTEEWNSLVHALDAAREELSRAKADASAPR